MKKITHMLILLSTLVLITAACGEDNTPVVQNTPAIDQTTDGSIGVTPDSPPMLSGVDNTPSESLPVTSEEDPQTTPVDPPASQDSSTTEPTTPVVKPPVKSVQNTKTVAPTLTVISPAAGEVVEGEKVTVKLKITDFHMVDFRTHTTPKKGEGHVHAWLDSDTSDPNAAFKLIEGDTITFDKVPAGEHKLTVQLVENNHQSIQPVIKQEIAFTTHSTAISNVDPAPSNDDSQGAVQTFTINIENYNYSQDELTVPVGSQVVFVNKDEINHTATVDGKFKSGMLKKDESFTVTLKEAGEYDVYCEPHPFMKMKIIVDDTQW